MSGPVSDLMFNIIAKDQSRIGFDSAGANADTWAKRNEAAAQRVSASMKMSSNNVGNLAAQYQDIIVSAQMGMSAWQIGLQQGTQMAAVLGPMGATGALRGLGQAFLSIVSPVSLVTIGLTVATAAVIQYFMSLNAGGQQSEQTLREQADLIARVAEKWGEAVPGLKDYVDQLERSRDVADLNTAGGVKIAEDLGSINKAMDDFVTQNDAVIAALNLAYDATGQSDTALSKFAASWQDLEPKVRAGTATQQDFATATALMRDAVAESGGDLDAFGTQFETIAGRILNSLSALQQFQAQMRDALIIGMKTQAQIQDLTSGQINNPNLPDPNFRLPGEGPLPDSRPLVELEGFPSVKGGSSSSAKSLNAYESAIQSMQERTRALEAQRAAQAGLNPLMNDYGFALAKAQQSTELLLAAEKAKLPISDELRAQVEAQASAYATVTAEMNKQTAAARTFQQQIDFAKSSTASFITTFRQDWMETGSAIDAAKNALSGFFDTMMTRMEQMAADKMITSFFGGIFGAVSPASSTSGSFLSFLTGGSNAFPSAPALSAGAMLAAAPAQRLSLEVALKKTGLNLEPEVSSVAGTAAMKVVDAAEARGDAKSGAYRAGQMKQDVLNTVKHPRRRG